MLERYFVRPATVDRLRSSWLGEPLDQYVAWLTTEGYAARNVHHRVPIIIQFGMFATARGVHTIAALPAQVDDFVEYWISRHDHRRQIEPTRETLRKEIRGPIEQFLRIAIPGFQGRGRARRRLTPFTGSVPRFFQYLREERGLRDATLEGYGHHLLCFEEYLRSIQLDPLSGLSPVVLSSFITDTSHGLSKKSIGDRCGILRVFLRYLHREGYLARDLSGAVEGPQVYRLSTIPRSITWDDVRRMLDGVDRRTVAGRRDYAILLLLVSYGLRAREVAALTLDNLDWGNERLRIPERKAGHSTAYPLSPVVGEAILAYLRSGRPTTADRHLFFRVVAPLTPITFNVVGCQAAHYLRKAGVQVPRPGSHTLRHTCVQRLVNRGLLPQDHRGLRRSPTAILHADLQQGESRRAPRRGVRPRRGGAMTPRGTGWSSPLAEGFVDFLAYKRALGRRFHVEELTFRLFNRFLVEQAIASIAAITPEIVEAFLASCPRTRPRSYNHLLGTIDRCFTWLCIQERVATSPVRARPRRVTSHRIPFLFNQAAARRLLEVALHLPDNGRALLRGLTYRTMFAVLYGLGLRVGEVSRLTVDDVDWDRQLLVIRETKFGKSRLVPFGPRLGRTLSEYLATRRTRSPDLLPTAPLFSFTSRGAIHPCTISQTFHRLVPQLGFVIPEGVASPRLHDLRHSFAVGTLLHWYQRGLDPRARLLDLSTFLGHVDPSSTAVYLTITPALLSEASQRFADFAAPVLPQGTP